MIEWAGSKHDLAFFIAWQQLSRVCLACNATLEDQFVDLGPAFRRQAHPKMLPADQLVDDR